MKTGRIWTSCLVWNGMEGRQEGRRAGFTTGNYGSMTLYDDSTPNFNDGWQAF